MHQHSSFKSTEGKDKILAYYNGILSYFPYTQKTVNTSYGKTFILQAGDPSSPPLILLHGSCSNTASWLGDIPALSQSYCVYAVDLPGEPGNSEDNRLHFDNDDYPRWLSDVIDALHVMEAVMIGNSLGGWLALHFAALYPARAKALVLLAPSGIVLPKQSFVEQTADITACPDKAKEIRDAILGDTSIPKEVLEFMKLIGEYFLPVTGALSVLSDTEMKAFTMPVLYIAGKKDIAIDSVTAAARLSVLLPQAEILLTDGAHAITSAADSILPFLDKVFSV